MPLIPRPSPIVRLRVKPLDPAAVDGPRPPGPRGETSRRPHTDAKVAAVRHLIVETTLTYGEIAAQTKVGRASICRWTRDHGWQRPAFAPRATDTIPRARAGRKLKLRLLAERLATLAERYVREMEESPAVDLDRLMQALNVLKMARLEAMGRRRRRRFDGETTTGAQTIAREDAVRTALKEMHRGGVDVDRAPQEAVDLVLDAYAPEDDSPALHPRGWRGR
jgi:inorganic triphosphatase YgiF